MTNMVEPMHLEEFLTSLDTFGGDLKRWPGERGAAALRLIETNSVARAAHREAQALDRVLAAAPVYRDAGRNDLVDRIMAEALSSLGREAPSNVVPLRTRALATSHRASTAWKLTPRRAGAAASLAASLLVGVMIGMTDLTPSSVTALVVASVDQADVDQSAAAASFDGLTEALDGEQL